MERVAVPSSTFCCTTGCNRICIDGPVERVGRVGVDAERHVLARPDAADVGLVDVRVDLHLRQVGGDDEERRRLHAGRDRLPDVHAALDDDAVDRRRDHGVIEVDLALTAPTPATG